MYYSKRGTESQDEQLHHEGHGAVTFLTLQLCTCIVASSLWATADVKRLAGKVWLALTGWALGIQLSSEGVRLQTVSKCTCSLGILNLE